ncbi:MAG: hypothetical protein IJN74_03615 [Clostridia bacterium]|nr:hypothetical protein [Clostridia bacterium]
MYYDMDMVQINDGLTETAACASSVCYDKANGLAFVAYLTGQAKRYGESSGKLCLSVFSPSQPENARRRVVDEGVGQSRGLLPCCHYLIGDAKTRMVFTTTRGELATFYRDYDFLNDTISERKEMYFRTGEGDVRLDAASYKAYLEKNYGLHVKADKEPLMNKASVYKGEIYTAVSFDHEGYPILCKIEDNVLVPFAICPQPQTYEFRYFINDDGIFGMYRVPPDDHGTGHAAFTVSKDGGKTWETKIFEDGVQSRPDIIEYFGKPLIVYNYKSDKSIENFPRMHNNRNAIKIIYDGEVIFEFFSKYGIVEYDFINIRGDLYMSFSNTPQALSTENGGAWVENGHPIEQGKEVIQWAKIGYLLGEK